MTVARTSTKSLSLREGASEVNVCVLSLEARLTKKTKNDDKDDHEKEIMEVVNTLHDSRRCGLKSDRAGCGLPHQFLCICRSRHQHSGNPCKDVTQESLHPVLVVAIYMTDAEVYPIQPALIKCRTPSLILQD